MPRDQNPEPYTLRDRFENVRMAFNSFVEDVRADVNRFLGRDPGAWDRDVVWRNDDGSRQVMTMSEAFDRERTLGTDNQPAPQPHEDEINGPIVRGAHPEWFGPPAIVVPAISQFDSQRAQRTAQEDAQWLRDDARSAQARREAHPEWYGQPPAVVVPRAVPDSPAFADYREALARSLGRDPMTPDPYRDAWGPPGRAEQAGENAAYAEADRPIRDQQGYAEAEAEHLTEMRELHWQEQQREVFGCSEACWPGDAADLEERQRAAEAHDAHMERWAQLEAHNDDRQEQLLREDFLAGDVGMDNPNAFAGQLLIVPYGDATSGGETFYRAYPILSAASDDHLDGTPPTIVVTVDGSPVTLDPAEVGRSVMLDNALDQPTRDILTAAPRLTEADVSEHLPGLVSLTRHVHQAPERSGIEP